MSCFDKAITNGGSLAVDDFEPLLKHFQRRSNSGGEEKVTKRAEMSKTSAGKGGKFLTDKLKHVGFLSGKKSGLGGVSNNDNDGNGGESERNHTNVSKRKENKRDSTYVSGRRSSSSSNKKIKKENNDTTNSMSNGKKKPSYKYKDVVRGEKRRQLPGHDCEQCQQFYDALCEGNSIFEKVRILTIHALRKRGYFICYGERNGRWFLMKSMEVGGESLSLLFALILLKSALFRFACALRVPFKCSMRVRGQLITRRVVIVVRIGHEEEAEEDPTITFAHRFFIKHYPYRKSVIPPTLFFISLSNILDALL